MTVSTGTDIIASEYNSYRTSIDSVYNTLYGQTIRSTAVSAGSDQVTSNQILQLFLDAQSTYVHQVGSIDTSVDVPSAGQTIGADTSQTFNQSTGALSTPTNGTLQGINDFSSIVSSIVAFNPSTTSFPSSNLTSVVGTSSNRTTTWGGTGQVQSVYHIVTVTFASASALAYYFNAGGEIRFSASLTGGTGSKSTDWANMLSAMGTVKFNKWQLTASSGTPNSSGSGYDSLTSSYRQLFVKYGSGVYAMNDVTIEGYNVNSTTIRFRISFNDYDTGSSPISPVDESVNGTITSFVNTARPSSSFVYNSTTYTAVDLPSPAVANVILLSSDYSTPPA